MVRFGYRFALLALLPVFACTRSGGPTALPAIASVVVVPENIEIDIGGTHRLTASLQDLAGNARTDARVAWSSSNEAIATVDADGVVRGVAGGLATITATSGSRADWVDVRVRYPAIASVDVVASQTRLLYGMLTQLVVTPRAADGSALSGCTIVVGSSGSGAVSVIEGGLATGFGVGEALITARAQCGTLSREGSITLTIDPIRFTTMAVGWGFACGIVQGGAPYCWGRAGDHLGSNARFFPTALPAPIAGTHDFVQIVAGSDNACGLTESGRAFCWGRRSRTSSGPQALEVTGGTFRSLDLAYGIFDIVWQCGISLSSIALCWGDNRFEEEPGSGGWLGIGSTVSTPVPTPVVGSIAFAHVTTGQEHACGIDVEGTAYCWGSNRSGRLGVGASGRELAGSLVPLPVSGGWRFTQLAASGHSTCGITTSGATVCWGNNVFGSLGDGSFVNRHAPVMVSGGMQFQSIAAGEGAVCGLTPEGGAFCWGFNQWAELGTGSTSYASNVPLAVAGEIRFTQLFAGATGACGIDTDGLAYCWGTRLPSAGLVPTLVPGQR